VDTYSTSPSTAPISDEQVRLATRATYLVFIGSGVALASWASRIPQVRAQFHLDPSALGLVLLAIAGGSVVSLPLSGTVIARFESRRTVSAMAVLLSLGLAMVAVGYLISLAVVVVGLFVLGLANGAWDVAMNVHGAAVERELGRSILPRFHAGWSLGSVVGALVGVVMVALGVPVSAHLAVVAVLIAITMPLATRHFIPSDGSAAGTDGQTAQAGDEAEGRRGALAAWREPRTLAVGMFVLAFAFAEGTGNDWISVASIDGYHVAAAVGTVLFATFLAAMTLGRWFAPTLLDRYGRVPVVRCLAITAIAGVALFVFGPAAPVAFIGVLLWGAGTSVGFPIGMSAGADDPRMAAARVSVIASIGYCAFLCGPPLIGFLGDHVTVLKAMTAVAVLMAVATMLAPSIRKHTSAPVSNDS
jgi:fucose permease